MSKQKSIPKSADKPEENKLEIILPKMIDLTASSGSLKSESTNPDKTDNTAKNDLADH